jgi:hypothetical protein
MSRSTEFDRIEVSNQGEVISQLTEQIILTYRGWDDFERAHGGPDIVDFDLSPLEGSLSFDSRRKILAEFSRLYDQLDGTSGEEEFLRARLQGSIFYLRALMGQQIPFPEYLQNTLGFVPQPFSTEEVEDARQAVIQSLAPFGLELRAEDRERFENQLLIRDANEIRKGIVGEQDIWLNRLRNAGIPVPNQPSITVQFAEVDAYWSNWIQGSAQNGITLTINLHWRKKYDKGRPMVLCLHEICGHAVQMSIWKDLIVAGKLNQACGLTTVHSPEMFVSEGLGQTVPELLKDDVHFPPEFCLSRSLQFHALVILHNAHLMLYENMPVEEILEYAHDNLPLSDPDAIDYEIRDRGRSPLFKSYLLSYGLAEHTIKKLLSNLSRSQKRDLFREMYTRPMTPAQLRQVADAVCA